MEDLTLNLNSKSKFSRRRMLTLLIILLIIVVLITVVSVFFFSPYLTGLQTKNSKSIQAPEVIPVEKAFEGMGNPSTRGIEEFKKYYASLDGVRVISATLLKVNPTSIVVTVENAGEFELVIHGPEKERVETHEDYAKAFTYYTTDGNAEGRYFKIKHKLMPDPLLHEGKEILIEKSIVKVENGKTDYLIKVNLEHRSE